MDNNNVLDDEIEIIDDFSETPKETEVLFTEEAPVTPAVPVYADATYTADSSLSSVNNVMFDAPSVGVEIPAQDPINMFNVEDKPVEVPTPITFAYEMPKVEVETPMVAPTDLSIEPQTIEPDAIASVESPDLSDELDNTLLLAKQAINPDVIPAKPEKQENEKSNKMGIIFIVILFTVLTAFILALPYITELVKNLK